MRKSNKAFAPLPMRALSDPRLTATHFRGLGAIAYRDRLGGGCFASSDELAELAGVNMTNLVTAISELVAWGYVSKQPSPKDKRKRVYRVLYHGIICPQANESSGDRLPTQERNRLPTGKRNERDRLPKRGDRLPKSGDRLPKNAVKSLISKETADPHSHRIQPLEDSHLSRPTTGGEPSANLPPSVESAATRGSGVPPPNPRDPAAPVEIDPDASPVVGSPGGLTPRSAVDQPETNNQQRLSILKTIVAGRFDWWIDQGRSGPIPPTPMLDSKYQTEDAVIEAWFAEMDRAKAVTGWPDSQAVAFYTLAKTTGAQKALAKIAAADRPPNYAAVTLANTLKRYERWRAKERAAGRDPKSTDEEAYRTLAKALAKAKANGKARP